MNKRLAKRSTTAMMTVSLVMAMASVGLASQPMSRGGPFDIIDVQNWVNPDNMSWDDYNAPPGTSWADPSRKGSSRNFNIALVTLDYSDKPFVITQPPNSTIFGNPQASAANFARKDVPGFYRDFLNRPTKLNRGHTLHEYWMEDSAGRFGVDLTAFGVYRMPALSFQYGIEAINPGGCPSGFRCGLNIRRDGLGLWRKDVGDEVANSFELVFILSAGQDESATWREFGEMKFGSRQNVSKTFGPPRGADGNDTLPNAGITRNNLWTSWASAATIWPNAGGGSSTQAESSGMAVYAHELSHLLNIGDNYNNPYSEPMRRDYTGPWSMMSRGSFNGPRGPHSRWQIPPVYGGSMGSLHTMRDRHQLGLVEASTMLRVPRPVLEASGPVVARLTARCVNADLLALRVEMGTDLSPDCDYRRDAYCDGGDYNHYDVEVIDRMGADSFQPDSGVMISKSKDQDDQPFQWTIDANPQDINQVDFYRPNGTAAMMSLGDYRQLSDALFHAGTRSGSKFEYADKVNSLHFYIVEKHRDQRGILSYTVGMRSLRSSEGSEHGAKLSAGKPVMSQELTPTGKGVFCSFNLTNNGTKSATGNPPKDMLPYLGSDIYRLQAKVEGAGWRVEVPNALAVAKFGETVAVQVAVGASTAADARAKVMLTVQSESDPRVRATAACEVPKG
ncbi:mucin [Drechmeria coniospora]|uniref:Mucin n=1 Tax=Drechmeria coniospora TaxID=98403 RepID=A0A151GHH0_DRECN|nr:mucin [Drechmeria coniospora]KYK56565.1 mucin [Drechmeria coniospora]